MRAPLDNSRQHRRRELLIFAAFLLICGAGALTVLVPETRDDRDSAAEPTGDRDGALAKPAS